MLCGLMPIRECETELVAVDDYSFPRLVEARNQILAIRWRDPWKNRKPPLRYYIER